ncbi:DUF6622 family protein [Paenibacillus sp. FSL K6-1230]|uniref:DUF6622 family protein n=1 Tax=Paenibacillus sp. FSL K6-1230 TaxID=2921603 RepID=UPI0003A48181
MFIVEVIRQTPLYIWFLLAFLIVRGLRSAKDGVLSIPKMVIVPVIFMLWGLETIFTRFEHLGVALVGYLFFAALGTLVGNALYAKYRTIYQKEQRFYRSGTYLPLIVILMNFVVKYALNVSVILDSSLYGNLVFTVLYCLFSGVSVGLFIGGIWNAYVCSSRLKLST